MSNKELDVSQDANVSSNEEKLGVLDTKLNLMGLVATSFTALFGILSVWQTAVAWETGNYDWRDNAHYAMIFGALCILIGLAVPPLHYLAGVHFERKRGVKGWCSLKAGGVLLSLAAAVHGIILLEESVNGAKTTPYDICLALGFALVAWAFMFGFAESARLTKKKKTNDTEDITGLKEDIVKAMEEGSVAATETNEDSVVLDA